ncbi:hypothetical protein A4N80_22615 [Salmonella enterica subsp. enterica serovar Mississippi]|uniref:Uncharacterized protein n=3 Tax=Salmonella enterica TaxID=28901 RepID=A0A5U1F5Z3_SALER|nr:hypothetical protein [Salmonella enterica subsp. enterica serovar Durham]EAA3088323.1 hypothetical protein [Salmonella enterica subsp. enterica serovar Telelkebir]EAA4650652.1 hypothetical protein [Salmonella enterica subsp. enterica serovar Mississippi]EAM3431322.1 hypothetical protein [Salmonella enterica]ECA4967627.1 hypothetical protein [Salmonella enterica subsp. enterica serovar Jukestown]ECA6122977.1 hypothetical protein [Salmonella enterica subsp. enterica serovar Redlands]ECD76663
MILPHLILEVVVVKQRRCLQMQRKFIEELYLVILLARNGMGRTARVSFIVIRAKMARFTGMVERNPVEG